MPAGKTRTTYRIREFAQLAGVTVRALHHYDRLGLLKPSLRSDSGYRLYVDRDLGRLEQIVVLKFLGLPLKQIRALIRGDAQLPQTLRHQRRVLSEKRRQLEHAINTIAMAERAVAIDRGPAWGPLRHIIKEIEMQNDTDWSKKYYSDEAQQKIEARQALWSPELQEQVTQQWTKLVADIEASLGEDPASPVAQALAVRWRALVAGFTGGDPEVQRGLNRMWSDQSNWPADQQQRFRINPDVQEFIVKAMQVGSATAGS